MANAASARALESRPFQAGRLVMTHTVERLVVETPFDPTPYLLRHLSCDWGDISESDRASNNRALRSGDQLLSSYKVSDHLSLRIITATDRSTTTMRLPSDD